MGGAARQHMVRVTASCPSELQGVQLHFATSAYLWFDMMMMIVIVITRPSSRRSNTTNGIHPHVPFSPFSPFCNHFGTCHEQCSEEEGNVLLCCVMINDDGTRFNLSATGARVIRSFVNRQTGHRIGIHSAWYSPA